VTKPDALQVGSLPEWEREPLDAMFTLHRLYEAPDRTAFLAAVGPRIRAIVTRGDLGAPRALLDACPRTEIVAIFGVGYDGVDLETCRARGIRVSNTPDVLTDDCADLAVGMMLALSRGIAAADRFVRDGAWQTASFPPQRRAWGRRCGILGLGRIGRAVAERLQGFGMEIAYSARSAKHAPPGWTFLPDPVELAAWSDVLFVTLVASTATKQIVDARVMAALGPEGSLINISRAANIDEPALLDALESGQLGAAALDVFENEPRLDPRFLALPNVLLQPHHASGTVETRRAMGRLMRDNLAAHFAGLPLLTPVI
jgi:lactate dehydrogenase-like 2-hydroxyacid dehydrogenase